MFLDSFLSLFPFWFSHMVSDSRATRTVLYHKKRKKLLPFFISSSNSLGKELINIVGIKGSPDWRVKVLKTHRDLWPQTPV